ncbi:MAG: DUF354 domain-containing protein [Kiloniellales bacterium]
MTPNGKQPCVIFDCHHPKHFLAIRRLGELCRNRGIKPIWTIQDKDVLATLIREHGYEPHILATAQKGLLRKLGELAVYDWRLARLALHERPLALIGKTVSLAQVGWLLGIPGLLINDDSAAGNPQYRYLACPFARRVITAECLGEDYGAKQRTYAGLMELAYLHPDAFSPDPGIRDELGVGRDERLFLIRLAAFDAYHDVGGQGLPRALLERLIQRLEAEGRVFIVSEEPLPGSLARFRLPTPAARLHHVIAACDLVLGDGRTVCVEAALLGVPAIAVRSDIDKYSYTEVIEKRFGLMFGFTPDHENELVGCVESLLHRPGIKEEWRGKHEVMLREWGDPTDVYWEELCAAIAPALERCPA